MYSYYENYLTRSFNYGLVTNLTCTFKTMYSNYVQLYKYFESSYDVKDLVRL